MKLIRYLLIGLICIGCRERQIALRKAKFYSGVPYKQNNYKSWDRLQEKEKKAKEKERQKKFKEDYRGF